MCVFVRSVEGLTEQPRVTDWSLPASFLPILPRREGPRVNIMLILSLLCTFAYVSSTSLLSQG